MHGNADVCQLLVAFKADVNAKGYQYDTRRFMRF
jgi:hypothetical protein